MLKLGFVVPEKGRLAKPFCLSVKFKYSSIYKVIPLMI